MSNRVLLQYKTKYVYDSPVFLSTQLVRLKLAVHSRTLIDAYSFLVTPANHYIHWLQDPYGNFLARIDFVGAVQEMVLEVKLITNLNTMNPFDFFVDEYAQFFPFEYEPQLKQYLIPYLEIIDKGPLILQWLEKADLSNRRIVDF